MSSNSPVNDEDILNGFASLHQAMTTGFDQVNARFDRLEGDVARMEHRMLRRFDDIDERFDRHERRITALEARVT